jgi:son of sevenless-like protein
VPQETLPKPSALKAKNILFFDFDPSEMARQLTLLESRHYCRIKPHELLKQEWSVKKRESKAVNVRAMSSFSTKISTWVVKNILSESDPRKRATILKFYIKLMQKCMMLCNFSAVMAIKSALQSSAINRLKRTWDILSDKHKTTMELISQATDFNRNYSAYRTTLRNARGVCIPFLGVYLTDLVFIDEGNPDYHVSGQINIEKYIKVYQIIKDIQSHQQPYPFQEIRDIQNYLLSAIDSDGSFNAEELYDLSLAVEPREEKESIKKAIKLDSTVDKLHKTGLL